MDRKEILTFLHRNQIDLLIFIIIFIKKYNKRDFPKLTIQEIANTCKVSRQFAKTIYESGIESGNFIWIDGYLSLNYQLQKNKVKFKQGDYYQVKEQIQKYCLIWFIEYNQRLFNTNWIYIPSKILPLISFCSIKSSMKLIDKWISLGVLHKKTITKFSNTKNNLIKISLYSINNGTVN